MSILLNGALGIGKTTTARALLDRAVRAWLVGEIVSSICALGLFR